MAQKGMSLNPGADPTLVAAAYRAGMANVPKDLSGTFEALAKSYGETMKSVSESWNESIKTVAKLGAPLIKQAVRDSIIQSKYEGVMLEDKIVGYKKEGKPGWQLTIDESDDPSDPILEPYSVADKLREMRKELRSLWGKQDKDSKIRRNALKAERKHLYNNLEYLDNADNFTNDKLAKGLVDLNASGSMALLMQSALTAYKTKSKVILGGEYDGFHVTLAADANNDFNFILRNKEGDIVTGEGLDGEILTEKGGKPFSVPMNEFADLLIPKFNDSSLKVIQKKYQTLLQSTTKNYNDTGHRNFIAGFVQDEASLFGLIQHGLGGEVSWDYALNNESKESATMFAGIDKAKLKAMGVVDIGKEGYDEEDFTGAGVATTNYKIVKDALLNRKSRNYDFKTTQKLFLDYAEGVGRDMHVFKNPNATTGRTRMVGGQQISAEVWQGDYVPYIDFLNNPTEGQNMFSPKGFDVKFENGEWFIGGTKHPFINVVKADKLLNYVDTSDSTTENEELEEKSKKKNTKTEIVEIENEEVVKVDWQLGTKTVRKNANGQWQVNTGFGTKPRWEIAYGDVLKRIKENYK